MSTSSMLPAHDLSPDQTWRPSTPPLPTARFMLHDKNGVQYGQVRIRQAGEVGYQFIDGTALIASDIDMEVDPKSTDSYVMVHNRNVDRDPCCDTSDNARIRV